MRSSREILLETLEKIRGVPVLVVGDIILDRYIWGGVERISPEAPVPVVDVKKIEDRLGGAGYVVRNLVNIGAKVSLCGFVGDDEEGQTVLKLLENDHVEKDGVLIDRGRPTCLKTRVIAQRQQIVRVDREDKTLSASPIREGFAAVVDAHLDKSKVVIVSDYGKGTVTDSVMKKLSLARSAKRLGLGVRPLFVDPHPRNYGIYEGLSIAKPNRKEAEAASGIRIDSKESAVEAAKVLLKKWSAEMMVITLGEGGLVIHSAKDPKSIFLETVAREVFDVVGAGDTVTAVFAAAAAVGATPEVAGELANIAAGIVVSEIGTVPVTIEKLKKEIDYLAAHP